MNEELIIDNKFMDTDDKPTKNYERFSDPLEERNGKHGVTLAISSSFGWKFPSSAFEENIIAKVTFVWIIFPNINLMFFRYFDSLIVVLD